MSISPSSEGVPSRFDTPHPTTLNLNHYLSSAFVDRALPTYEASSRALGGQTSERIDMYYSPMPQSRSLGTVAKIELTQQQILTPAPPTENNPPQEMRDGTLALNDLREPPEIPEIHQLSPSGNDDTTPVNYRQLQIQIPPDNDVDANVPLPKNDFDFSAFIEEKLAIYDEVFQENSEEKKQRWNRLLAISSLVTVVICGLSGGFSDRIPKPLLIPLIVLPILITLGVGLKRFRVGRQQNRVANLP